MRRLLLCLALAGCARAGAVDAALHGDLARLRETIAEESRQGAIDRDRAREIARAVAEREVYSATGPDGARRIRSLRRCAEPLFGVLEARAETLDEGGAEATLSLLAFGRAEKRALVRRFARSDSGSWRAVAARAATLPEHFALRRAYFADPDERVRRAALEAAYERPGSLDLDALAEAARLDPDPMWRSLAVRAIGASGGERALRALADLWERSEEDVRLSIVEAWSARRAFASGGRAALLREAESGRGVTAAAAAGTLLRVDPSSRDLAVTLLVRSIGSGGSDEQRLAITLIPLERPDVIEALRGAARGADPGVQVSALERLVELSAERSSAVEALVERSRGDSRAAVDARAALARMGARAPAATLRKELASRDAGRRTAAGQSLLALGEYASAARLLGDGSADVRVATACAILALD